MAHLPTIIGFGGINPAGRSSGFHGYKRLVIESLSESDAVSTYADLAMVTGRVVRRDDQVLDAATGEPISAPEIASRYGAWLRDNTLIRQLENNVFDRDRVRVNREASVQASDASPVVFKLKRSQIPHEIPATWQVEPLAGGSIQVTVREEATILLPDHRPALVQSGGQLPTGFDPEALYNSRSHPRSLALAVYGASDAVQSLGIDWEVIRQRVAPDQIGVYAASAMGQWDFNGSGGVLQSQLLGKRISAKQLALSLSEMPADFVNAYVIGGLGSTGAIIGACATFLYNLRQGVRDIQSGRRRVVLVGGAESQINAEVMEGYRTMGALAEDEALLALDPGRTTPDYRRASRPFSDNCGFTISEASQYVVLCDDALALELGANIYGSVGDVFVNADGYKKSIPGPGVGNYLTVAKAAAVTRAIIGEEGLRNRTYMHAHGTSTPQNRVTESAIMNEVAKAFGIAKWPVAAIKAFLGHTIGVAGGDQVVAALGTWRYGLIPGIKTIDHLADDVESSNLDFLLSDADVGVQGMDAAILNSKGFGGNNASASILAPHVTERLIAAKHGAGAIDQWRAANAAVAERTAQYDADATAGKTRPIYLFDHNVLDGNDIAITADELRVSGLQQRVNLNLANPYVD